MEPRVSFFSQFESRRRKNETAVAAMRPVTALLLLCVLHCAHSYAKDVETALKDVSTGTLQQVPCVRLMTAQAGDVGCSSTCLRAAGAWWAVRNGNTLVTRGVCAWLCCSGPRGRDRRVLPREHTGGRVVSSRGARGRRPCGI